MIKLLLFKILDVIVDMQDMWGNTHISKLYERQSEQIWQFANNQQIANTKNRSIKSAIKSRILSFT